MSSPRRIERTGAVNRRTSGIFSPVFNLCCLKQSYSSLVLDMAHRGGKGREEIVRESTIRLDMATFRHSCQHDGKFSPALWVWGGGAGVAGMEEDGAAIQPESFWLGWVCHLVYVMVAFPCAQIYRPSFCENKPKMLVLYDWKRAFWVCFRENWVYKFGRWKGFPASGDIWVSRYLL